MLKTLSRSIVWAVILIMTFECISSAIAKPADASIQHVTVHSKTEKPSVFAAMLSERAEETERNEEERDKIFSVELADFSKIATALSISHSPLSQLNFHETSYRAQPKRLFAIFCVLLI
jgi:hypothetical protein